MLRFSSFRTYPSLLFQLDHAAETASAVYTSPIKKLRFFPLTSAFTEHTLVFLPKHVVGRQGQPLLGGALCFWKVRGRQHTVWAFHRDQLILPVDCLPFPPINPPNILEISVSQNEDQFTDIFSSLQYTHM